VNDREIAFCEAYLVCQNATQAALAAGYSESTAVKNGSQFLKREHIQEYLGQLTKKVESRALADATTVINGYAAIANASPLDVLVQNERGLWEGCAPEDLPDAIRPAISKVHIKDVKNRDGDVIRQTYSYELHDRMQALLQLGKHFQVFGDAPPVQNNLNLFANVPQKQLEELAGKFNQLIGSPSQAQGETVDGEVLPND
jgi:phage terminase small subunit